MVFVLFFRVQVAKKEGFERTNNPAVNENGSKGDYMLRSGRNWLKKHKITAPTLSLHTFSVPSAKNGPIGGFKSHFHAL